MFLGHASSFVLLAFLIASGAVGKSDLSKIKHIVLFMQENRAFDHYFGTMAGVRGFGDPNVHVSKNTHDIVFNQPVDWSVAKGQGPHGIQMLPPSDIHMLQPFYLNWQGGKWKEKTQCMVAGTNDWRQNHEAWNNGEMDRWAIANTPYSLGYLKEEDIPVQWHLANKFTTGDMYYESIISSTSPNRVAWFSGTINPPKGSKVNGTNRNMGGPVFDNHEAHGCEKTDAGDPMSCMPLKWKTVPEYLENSNITWRVYQDKDNFGDNPLVYYTNFQESAKNKGKLARQGTAYPGLEKFYEDAENGNLPEVSYIIGPTQLSEHPPYMPMDGAWIQGKVANAVMNGKNWASTALIYSYDETGGWADHVISPLPPKSEQGEWTVDPYHKDKGLTPIGPGFRLPFYIVSPWTQGGNVFTEHASHESQILFLEQWAKAVGKPFYTHEIGSWRRKHMSNLVNAFDFNNEDTSTADVPNVRQPSKDLQGKYNGGDICQAKHLHLVQPHIPYGKQDQSNSMEVQKGFKAVRGDLTEGRYLTFESRGHALSHTNGKLSVGNVSKKDKPKEQLFLLHWQGSAPKDNRFKISTIHGHYITKSLELSENASDGAEFSIRDQSNGSGHAIIELESNKRLSLSQKTVAFDDDSTLSIFSVTI